MIVERIVRYALAVLFAICALIQLNDPDPAVWVVAYGLVALSVAAPPDWPWASHLAWLAGGVLLALGLSALPGFVAQLLAGDPGALLAEMGPDRPNVEPAREFLGVMIAAAGLIGARFMASRRAAG